MTELRVGAQGHALPEHVYVTSHALVRLRERFPEFSRADDTDLIKLVSREITSAFQAGRVARTQPRWTVYHDPSINGGNRGHRNKGKHRSMVYAWVENERRCYCVVKDKHRRTGKLRISVRTVFSNHH